MTLALLSSTKWVQIRKETNLECEPNRSISYVTTTISAIATNKCILWALLRLIFLSSLFYTVLFFCCLSVVKFAKTMCHEWIIGGKEWEENDLFSGRKVESDKLIFHIIFITAHCFVSFWCLTKICSVSVCRRLFNWKDCALAFVLIRIIIFNSIFFFQIYSQFKFIWNFPHQFITSSANIFITNSDKT